MLTLIQLLTQWDAKDYAMPEITLCFAPSTCARVTMTALETIGCDYTVRLVRFLTGEHRSAEYLALNPRGKVPTMIYDGEILTENVAILTFLNGRYPEARLLPPADSDFDEARQLADLCFCSATLHPLVSRIRFPMFQAEGEAAIRSVYENSINQLRFPFDLIERRLASGGWWYPTEWSVMDAYLYWVWFRVNGAGFPGGDYPAYADHARRMEALPQVQRMLARDAEALEQLHREGHDFMPPPLSGKGP